MSHEELNCLNMLSEMDLEEGRHHHCLLLIKFFLGDALIAAAPLDLSVKLAAAGIITGEVNPLYIYIYIYISTYVYIYIYI